MGGTYENEISWMKAWISERLLWIDNNIGAIGSSSVGLPEENQAIKTVLYPNPASDFVTLKLENIGPGTVDLQIMTITGQILASEAYTLSYEGTWLIPVMPRLLPAAAPGHYLIHINFNGQKLAEEQLIIR